MSFQLASVENVTYYWFPLCKAGVSSFLTWGARQITSGSFEGAGLLLLLQGGHSQTAKFPTAILC